MAHWVEKQTGDTTQVADGGDRGTVIAMQRL